jgi:hypothetical protein
MECNKKSLNIVKGKSQSVPVGCKIINEKEDKTQKPHPEILNHEKKEKVIQSKQDK